MNYCGWDDINYSGDTCSRCVAEERHQDILAQARESAEDTARAIRESDYRRANPGNYECPLCLYVSLRRGASRCPTCQGDVPSDHWAGVFAAEKARADQKQARKAAEAAEWARNAPVRAAAAAAAAKEAEERSARNAAIARRSMKLDPEHAEVLFSLYFAYLFPVFVLGVGHIWLLLTTGESEPLAFIMMTTLVPVLNWLALAHTLLASNERAIYFMPSVVFLALGAVFKVWYER
jgi:hypothetical protein